MPVPEGLGLKHIITLRKGKQMKKAIAIVITLALATMSGCNSSSPEGGSVLKGEGFRIAVPTLDVKLQQGEVQNVMVSLERGEYFKQDVKLEITLSKGEGISVEPTSVIVKANDKPDVQLSITAAKNAAIGEYHVSVKGIPKTGESTSKAFTVKVVSP
jgi:uncharacterized membrane protein